MHNFIDIPVLNAVGTMVLLVFAGFFISKLGLFSTENAKFVASLVINVTLPCNMVVYITTNFTKDILKDVPVAVSITLVVLILGYFAGFWLGRLFRLPDKRCWMMAVITGQTNTIFMGLPVNLALFGDSSIPYVLFFYMGNTVLLWTFGAQVLGENPRIRFDAAGLKKLFNPPLLALLLAMIMALFSFKLPDVLNTSAGHIGSMTTPLSMLFIGQILSRSKIRIDRDVLVALAGRFIIGPGIAILVFMLFPMDPLMKNVFIIQSSMPVLANLAIFTDANGGDSEFAAICISVTTIVSVLYIPVMYTVFGMG